MLQVEVKKLNEAARYPTKGSKDSAGWDLYSTEECLIQPGEIKMVGTGLAFNFSRGMLCRLYSRSGHGKLGVSLANGVGVVDSDYRGEVKVLLRNDGKEPFEVKVGDRIAQAIFEVMPVISWKAVDTLSETERGSGGFGSTGR